MKKYYEIRLHGIGGQGVAAAADLMGLAAVKDGRWSHSFPFFGTEIRGGVVTAYTRISDEPIHTRSFIYDPEMVVIFADYLVTPEVLAGSREGTVVLVNASGKIEGLPGEFKGKLHTVDADGITRGIPGLKAGNGAMMGAIAGLSGQVSVSNLEASIKEMFNPETAGKIIESVRLGYTAVNGKAR